ncbi:MAG TPA: hypothetical protein VJI98_03510 [Candidatus Nanoarchaeia archaeon]|nr:hypothetical protein [Candidatus Nanoarchaeia archaeon]
MGFGYNPDLTNFGERLDILNFFSWMRNLGGTLGSTEWTIFDASGYGIVNRMPEKKIMALGNKPTGQQILEVLVSEQERPKRAEIMQNCELRSSYLQRLIEISGIKGRYVDSKTIFRESERYQGALDAALWFVEKLKTECPDLIERIQPKNPNPASQLYLPLEMAEAVYLWNVNLVKAKFGPTTEKDFDEAILGLLEEQLMAYETFRCSFGPRRPGYLSDRNVIWTKSPDAFVTSILARDKEYRNFVAQYLQPFREGDEPLESCAMRMRDQLKLEEVLS